MPKDTRPVSLSDELRGDGPKARRADLAGYKAGFQTLFVDGANDGVLASAWEYKRSSYASVVVTDPVARARTEKEVHGASRPVPLTAPGTHRVLMAGRVPEAGAIVPAYLYVWQHGTTVNLVMYFGVHATQAHMLEIAAHQDRREARAGV